MPMILLVVVGSINQSNSVGLYGCLCGCLHRVMWVFMGLRRDFLRGGGDKNQDFMLIRPFNANDLIGCDEEH